MRIIKWTVLICINLFLDFFCFWVLLYLETYINDFFIPENFIWNNGAKRDKPLLIGVVEDDLILCLEASLILFVFYLLNRWLFVDLLALKNPKIVAKKIYILSAILMLTIILVTTIQAYIN